MDYLIRPALQGDEAFLWQMLYYAAHMNEDGALSAESAKGNPDLASYVAGWGGRGDLGVIAVDKATSGPLGAAWLRPMPAPGPLYRFVPPETLEVAIAVAPEHRGRGIGGRMLVELLGAARNLYPTAVLSVRSANSARRLYARCGFAVIAQVTNRIGGSSFVMTVRL